MVHKSAKQATENYDFATQPPDGTPADVITLLVLEKAAEHYLNILDGVPNNDTCSSSVADSANASVIEDVGSENFDDIESLEVPMHRLTMDPAEFSYRPEPSSVYKTVFDSHAARLLPNRKKGSKSKSTRRSEPSFWTDAALVSTREEDLQAREYWFSLSPEEHCAFLEAEWNMARRYWQEYRVSGCVCSYCSRERSVIQSELANLYDSYFVELTRFRIDILWAREISGVKPTELSKKGKFIIPSLPYEEPSLSDVFFSTNQHFISYLGTYSSAPDVYIKAIYDIATFFLKGRPFPFFSAMENYSEIVIKMEDGMENPHASSKEPRPSFLNCIKESAYCCDQCLKRDKPHPSRRNHMSRYMSFSDDHQHSCHENDDEDAPLSLGELCSGPHLGLPLKYARRIVLQIIALVAEKNLLLQYRDYVAKKALAQLIEEEERLKRDKILRESSKASRKKKKKKEVAAAPALNEPFVSPSKADPSSLSVSGEFTSKQCEIGSSIQLNVTPALSDAPVVANDEHKSAENDIIGTSVTATPPREESYCSGTSEQSIDSELHLIPSGLLEIDDLISDWSSSAATSLAICNDVKKISSQAALARPSDARMPSLYADAGLSTFSEVLKYERTWLNNHNLKSGPSLESTGSDENLYLHRQSNRLYEAEDPSVNSHFYKRREFGRGAGHTSRSQQATTRLNPPPGFSTPFLENAPPGFG